MTMQFPNLFPAERIWGNLNLGPGHFMNAPGGFVGLGNRKGKIIFVDPLFGNNAWDGTLPQRFGLTTQGPKLTVAAALLVAVNYDVIVSSWGDINEDNLAITQTALKLIGLSNSGSSRGTPLFIGTAASILKIEADDVEIAGFGFAQTFAGKTIEIAPDAGPASRWRPYIHDCYFDGFNAALFGIWEGNTWDCPYVLVENCDFKNMAGPSIYQNATGAQARGNRISVATGMVGIEDVPNAGGRPGRWVLGNKFITQDVVNGVGVKVDNTPDPGQLMIDDNHFVNFANAAHACDVSGSGKTGLMGLNYLGLTAIPIS
jgi:hypothetical protein